MSMNHTLSNSKKITQAIRMLNNAAQEKKDAIQESLTRFGKGAQKVAYQSSRRVKKAAQKVDAKVHENPWTVIGAAAATALAMGFLLGKVNRK